MLSDPPIGENPNFRVGDLSNQGAKIASNFRIEGS